MKSLYAKLIIALQIHFYHHFPEMKYVELDMQQLDNYDIRPAVAWPCCLMDINSNYEQRQFQTQISRINIAFKLGWQNWGNTSSITPQEYREQALQYFEAENKLYELLQDWNAYGLLTEPFRRAAVRTIPRADGIRERMITYTCAAADANLSESQWSTLYNQWLVINGKIAQVNSRDVRFY